MHALLGLQPIAHPPPPSHTHTPQRALFLKQTPKLNARNCHPNWPVQLRVRTVRHLDITSLPYPTPKTLNPPCAVQLRVRHLDGTNLRSYTFTSPEGRSVSAASLVGDCVTSVCAGCAHCWCGGDTASGQPHRRVSVSLVCVLLAWGGTASCPAKCVCCALAPKPLPPSPLNPRLWARATACLPAMVSSRCSLTWVSEGLGFSEEASR